MNEELKQFDINIEDIEFSENLLDNIHEAINKMKLHTLSDKFEIVLNNNLIEAKEKLTNFRTILGCRISYDNLDKNISFIIKEDNKPSYEELEKRIKRCSKYLYLIDSHEFISDIPIAILNGSEQNLSDWNKEELSDILKGEN